MKQIPVPNYENVSIISVDKRVNSAKIYFNLEKSNSLDYLNRKTTTQREKTLRAFFYVLIM